MPKRRLLSFFLVFVLLCFTTPLSAFADNRELIVYYAVGSDSAYRYHARSNCPSLSRSTVGEITLEEAARRGYTPCNRCHPPAPDFDVSATPRPRAESGSSSSMLRPSETPRLAATPRPTSTRRPTVTPKPTTKPKPTATPSLSKPVTTRSSSSDRSDTFTVTEPQIEAVLWGIVGLGAIFFWLKGKIEDKKAQKKRLDEEKRRQQEWEKARPHYLAEYGQKPISELCRMPEDCYVKDGLPACKHGDGAWGDGYTVYVTYSGQYYHRADCSRIRGRYTKEINASRIQGYAPCSTCCPKLPPLTWYLEYLKIVRIRSEYQIDEPAQSALPVLVSERSIEAEQSDDVPPQPPTSSGSEEAAFLPEPLSASEEVPQAKDDPPVEKPSDPAIPENCFIGEDGLPACKNGPERWGEGYTFYMTSSGHTYHTKHCKIGQRSPFHPINAYIAKTGFRYYDGPQYYRPCKYCNPVLPDLTWYERMKGKK